MVNHSICGAHREKSKGSGPGDIQDSGNKIPHVMILFGDQGSKDFPSGKSRKGRGKPAQGPRTNPTGREKGPRTNAETAIFQNGSGSDVQNGSGFVQIHIKRPRTKG